VRIIFDGVLYSKFYGNSRQDVSRNLVSKYGDK